MQVSYDGLEAMTDAGNLAVVVPAAFTAVVWLVLRRGPRAGLGFLFPILVAFAITVTLKMVSRETGGALHQSVLALSDGAPSGHASMSAAVYGGVAMILLRRAHRFVALGTTLVALAAIAMVAVTRVLLHDHTPADVAAGLLIGGVCGWWAGWRTGEGIGPWPRAGELALVAVIAALVAHATGWRFDSTEFL